MSHSDPGSCRVCFSRIDANMCSWLGNFVTAKLTAWTHLTKLTAAQGSIMRIPKVPPTQSAPNRETNIVIGSPSYFSAVCIQECENRESHHRVVAKFRFLISLSLIPLFLSILSFHASIYPLCKKAVPEEPVQPRTCDGYYISENYICDGKIDCTDSSDEMNCQDTQVFRSWHPVSSCPRDHNFHYTTPCG